VDLMGVDSSSCFTVVEVGARERREVSGVKVCSGEGERWEV
jgi:hypothetical protein